VPRLDPAAITAVISRDATVFSRYWRSTTFSSIVQPLIYLLAFGFGIGNLVSRAGGLDYKQYVGTGMVATAVLFSSMFPGMFTTFVRRTFQRTYDAMLAAPLSVEELVTAEGISLALRAGVYGCAPLLVAIAFGLRPGAGIILVPFIGFTTGLGFALFGIFISGVAKSIDNFGYVTSAVITPLFLLAGTFFPITGFPRGVRIAVQFNPLYHCVQLVRDAVLHLKVGPDLVHFGALLLFVVISWILATIWMRKRLID
jgi:lipooligosaccharide transport system permease protein